MSGEAQLRSIQSEEDREPLVFISHRHADRRIADRLRSFLREKSGNSVGVYQSSAADAQAPRIGHGVNSELVAALGRSDVLILIYTGSDRGWDYCMWECGVATHPNSPDTSVVVLQCGPERPKVFEDHVTVDSRDPVMVQRFANSFLTDPDFFARRPDAVTRFQPNGESVRAAARELYDSLGEVVSAGDYGTKEEWQAMPFVRLSLTRAQIQRIAEQDDEEQASILAGSVLLEANVVASEGGAAALFGKLTLPPDEPFGQIFSRPLPEGKRPVWLQGLADQVTRAAMWSYPSSKWSLMNSASENDSGYYSPVLTRVERDSSGSMKFDVHFYRFSVRPEEESITLPLPEAAAG